MGTKKGLSQKYYSNA